MFQVTTLQKILSYLLPVKIWEGSSAHNAALELFLNRGEWQLTTEDAVYSDGSHYRPLKLAFGKLRQQLTPNASVLVLGAGLGSALSILDKMRKNPVVTMVDIDDLLIRINSDWLFKHRDKTRFICQDASVYMAETTGRFDIIAVDVFKGRDVPAFVTSPAFLLQCRGRLTDGGFLVINYIISDKKEWETFSEEIQKIFPPVKVYELGVNRVVIAKV